MIEGVKNEKIKINSINCCNYYNSNSSITILLLRDGQMIQMEWFILMVNETANAVQIINGIDSQKTIFKYTNSLICINST